MHITLCQYSKVLAFVMKLKLTNQQSISMQSLLIQIKTKLNKPFISLSTLVITLPRFFKEYRPTVMSDQYAVLFRK